MQGKKKLSGLKVISVIDLQENELFTRDNCFFLNRDDETYSYKKTEKKLTVMNWTAKKIV